MRVSFIALVVLTFSGLTRWALAQVEEPIELREIVVTGTRLPEAKSEKELAAPISKVDRERIEETGLSSLPEALSLLPGLHLTDTIGFGYGSVRLHLRASGEFNNGLVLLEGVPITDPADHSVLWREIPVEAIESVEVVRGGTSSTFGETLNGVIQLQLPDQVKRTETLFKAGLGNFGRNKLFFSQLLGDEEKATFFSASQEHIGGFRRQSGFDGQNFFFSHAVPLQNTLRLKLVGSFFEETHTSPGALTEQEVNQDPKQPGGFLVRFDQSSAHLSAHLNKTWGSEGKLSLLAYFRQRRSRGENNSGGDSQTNTERRGAVLQLSSNGKLNWTLGSEVSTSSYEAGSTGRPFDLVKKAGFALFGEASMNFSKKLSLLLAFRKDWINYDLLLYQCGWDGKQCTWPVLFQGKKDASGNGPKIGLTFSPEEGRTFYLSYSHSFLSPTGFQFTSFDQPFFANPDIQPQIMRGLEMGFRGKFGKVSASANLFLNKTEREILFNPETFSDTNIDTRRRGFELEVRVDSRESQALLSYTLLRAEFDQPFSFFGQDINGKTLPLSPRHRLSFLVSKKMEPFRLSLNSTWVSDFFPLNDLANFRKASGYFVLNGKLSFKRGKTRWFLDLNNLTNELYSSFPSSNGQTDPSLRRDKFRPLPKFHLFSGVEWRL